MVGVRGLGTGGRGACWPGCSGRCRASRKALRTCSGSRREWPQASGRKAGKRETLVGGSRAASGGGRGGCGGGHQIRAARNWTVPWMIADCFHQNQTGRRELC